MCSDSRGIEWLFEKRGSETFGLISKSRKRLWWVSKSPFRVILRLGVSKLDTRVSQSRKVSNLPIYTPNSGVRVREWEKIRRMRGRLERGLFLCFRPKPKPPPVFFWMLTSLCPRSYNLNPLKKSRGDVFLAIFSLLTQTESLFRGYLENANGLWIEFEWSVIFHYI